MMQKKAYGLVDFLFSNLWSSLEEDIMFLKNSKSQSFH